MIRLGFPARIVGNPALRRSSEHTPRPDLRVRLAYLRDILAYLKRIGVQYFHVIRPARTDHPNKLISCIYFSKL